MTVCLSHISALDFFRAANVSKVDILGLPRTGKFDACDASTVFDALASSGFPAYLKPPVHVLVKGRSHSHSEKNVIRHSCHSDLPNRAFIRLTDELMVVSPELCSLQLCATLPELDAALAIFELCGVYSLKPNTNPRFSETQATNASAMRKIEPEDFFGLEEENPKTYGTRTYSQPDIARKDVYAFAASQAQEQLPHMTIKDWGFYNRENRLTSCKRIASFADSVPGAHGLGKLRTVLKYVLDNSASPMETALALMVTGPARIGGMGFKGATLNHRVNTIHGERRIDLLWAEQKFGLEYQGFDSHEGWTNRVKDDRRRNAIAAEGIDIASVYYQDLASPFHFDALISNIARIMGKRVRITTKDHRYKQMLLRKAVLPPASAKR
ncbi:hypothetical protein [uncultured Slackia sp.]|uniref:hypothetical protein n=1 Tax=uncultured Slackia sp. TaxID=665903 RepID=UPI0025EB2E50|nr:hypothetical protein [uncultured Slackia sp.]